MRRRIHLLPTTGIDGIDGQRLEVGKMSQRAFYRWSSDGLDLQQEISNNINIRNSCGVELP